MYDCSVQKKKKTELLTLYIYVKLYPDLQLNCQLSLQHHKPENNQNEQLT